MPKAPSTSAKAQTDQELPASYEEAVQELEQLLAKLESGQLPLDQLLTITNAALACWLFAAND